MNMITGGAVEFVRRVKTGDYEHAEFRATLNFSVPEGASEATAESMLEYAGILAHNQVQTRLGQAGKVLPVPAILGFGSAAGSPLVAAVHIPAEPVAEKPKAVRGKGKSDKDALAAAIAPVDGGVSMVEEIPAPASVREAPVAEVPDPAGMDAWGAEPAVITDAELLAAVVAKNEQINNAIAIRALIGKFVTPPKVVRDIPQEARAAFLEQLKAL